MKRRVTRPYEKCLSSDSSEGYGGRGKWRRDRHGSQYHPLETRTVAEECIRIMGETVESPGPKMSLSRQYTAGYGRLGRLKRDRKVAGLNHGGWKNAGSEEGSPYC